MIQYLSLCLLPLIIASSFAGSVKAQDSPARDAKLTQEGVREIDRTLDVVESEIVRRRTLLLTGSKIHADYVKHLSHDYRRVSNDILFARQQNLRAKLQSLQLTEKRLALQLWQLDRLRPMMAEVDEEYRSLTQTLRDLKSKYPEGITDKLVAERFQDVTAKVDEVERVRLNRRMLSDRNFYDVRMRPDLLSEQADQRQKQSKDQLRGPISQLQVPIQRLVRLKWDDGQFVVDRSHWEDLFLPESLAEIAMEVAAELEIRGWSLSTNAHRSFLPEKVFSAREPSVFLLFQNLRHAASLRSEQPTTTSLFRNSQGGEFSTDELKGMVANIDGRFVLSLQEQNGLKGHFLMNDSPTECKISILDSSNQLLELQQSPAGAVIRFKTEAESAERTGLTMADIYAENPEWIEQEIFPALQSVGVLVPETRFDSRVIDLVAAKIRATDSAVAQGLDHLLERADSPRFKVRTQAMKELESNLNSYGPLLGEIQRNASLSLEVRMRIKRAIELQQRDFGGIEQLIFKLNLINDADYLSAILDRVGDDEQQNLRSQLSRLSTRQP